MTPPGSITSSERLKQNVNSLVERWLVRRGPMHPPLQLVYRQIFILPTGFGWMLGALMFAMLIGSLNFNNNLGLLTTFIVAGLAVNGMLLAYRNLHGIGIRNVMAAPVFAGHLAQLHISLAGGERLRPALLISDGHHETRVRIDHTGTADAFLPLATHRRGWLKPPRLRVQTTWPLGLFRAWSWFRPRHPVLVWPRPADNPPPLPIGGGDRTGRQERFDPDGDEFHSLRRWREGDPVHRIAWKSSQRHQTLLSREYRQQQATHLVLDLTRAPGNGPENRISVVTAWVLMAERHDARWTLIAGNQRLGPDRGRAHRDACLKLLAEL